MKCPKCASKSSTYNTVTGRSHVQRFRICGKCEFCWQTIERFVTAVKPRNEKQDSAEA